MAIIYLSSWEYIREKTFEVYAPAFYHFVLPKAALQTKQPLEKVNKDRMVSIRHRPPPPMYQPHDPNQFQRCAYPIMIMLDMFQKGVEFVLACEADVVEILDNLDRFLFTIREDVETGNEKLTAQAELVIRWRAEVYKHYYRYMINNPEVKERLYPNQNSTQNIFHLMNLVGTNGRAQELDPLRAKGEPPYTVESLKPKEKVEDIDTSDDTFVGLPSHAVDLGDDGSFTLEDFCKR